MTSTFRTLEIIVQASETPPYPVVARLVDSDQTASGLLSLPFNQAQLDRALNWIEDGLFDDDFVRQFGGQLFDALFAGAVGDLYRELRRLEATPPRLRIITSVSQAAQAPWELLYDHQRKSFVALDMPLVRGLPLAGEARPLAVAAYPLRVLLADSFPAGLPRVQGEAEVSDIRARLAGLTRQRRVETSRLPNATLSALQDMLREAAAAGQPYHVLHFIGHGRSDRQSGKAVLLLEADDGQPQEVAPAVLAPMLSEFGVKLAFLNACQSAQSSAFDLAEGFAPALLAAGIPCVIGMQVSVLDDAARQFAGEFYAALADNQPVDVALTHARRLALGKGSRRKADLAIPVCYLRPPSGQILELHPPETVPLTRATAGAWLAHNVQPGRLLRSVYGVLAVVATLLGLFLAVQALTPEKPLGEMTGDFNIAVAAFGKLDPQGRASASSAGRDFASNFADELKTHLDQTTQDNWTILMWGPDKTGEITGDTPAERQRNAQTWAEAHNANLVIYGNVRDGFTKSEVLPEFLVVNKQLAFAEELADHYQPQLGIELTGTDVSLRGNATTRGTLRSKLTAWADEIASFAQGLGYFNQNRFEDAQRFLTASVSEDDDDHAQWRKVVNLFRGSAAGELGQYDEAERFYDEALAIDPVYARALLGKAQIVFLRARQGCTLESQTDVEGLQEALRLYRQASTLRAEPEAEIAVKVNYFSGAAALCLAQATGDNEMTDALRFFGAVIDEYNARANDPSAQARIAYLAASAYLSRGGAYAQLSKKGADGENASWARADFEAAHAMTSQDDIKAVASWWLGELHLWNEACPLAADEIARGDAEIARFVEANPSARLDDAAYLRCSLTNKPARPCQTITLKLPTAIQCPAAAN